MSSIFFQVIIGKSKRDCYFEDLKKDKSYEIEYQVWIFCQYLNIFLFVFIR